MPVTRTLLLAALSAALSFAAPAIAQQDNQDQDDQQSQQEHKDQQQRHHEDQASQHGSDQDRQHNEHSARHDEGRDHAQAGLGVFISDTRSGGVEVERVVSNSPADQAGLREGDRILSLNNQRVNSAQQLTRLISEQEPGSKVAIDLIRDGEQQQIQAQLASREQAMPQRMTRRMEEERGRRYSSDDERGQRGPSADRELFGERDRYNRPSSPGGNLEQRIARLESSLDRLTQQMNRLQSQLDQRSETSEFRTRSKQYDGRDRDQPRQAPNEQPQDSDSNRDF